MATGVGLPESRDQLSLALMDVRNHCLGLYAAMEDSLGEQAAEVLQQDGLPAPLWQLGHCAWFQEYWIARNPQRHLGRACPDATDRPSSLEPRSDVWWDDRRATRLERSDPMPGSADEVRAYLLATLEQTLELLERAPQEDDALHFFRMSLLHEERHAEQLLESAQVLGLSLAVPLPASAPTRPGLLVSATRWSLGHDPARPGFSRDHERPAHPVEVPEFEIDAQAVTWAQFIEFVDDAGYERPELWHAEGWASLRASDANPMPSVATMRRFPRFVEQMGGASGAVLQRRFGQLLRLSGDQPVMHVSWWEADAWCRWAGRRLPAEVEWDLASYALSGRGWRWGDVLEWTGTTARHYPGFMPDRAQPDPMPTGDPHKVMRGASSLTRPSLRRQGLRRYALPGSSHHFCGFRSCAL